MNHLSLYNSVMPSLRLAWIKRMCTAGLWLAVVFGFLTSSACLPLVRLRSNQRKTEEAHTYAAQEFFARLTLQSGHTAVAQLTRIAQQAGTPKSSEPSITPEGFTQKPTSLPPPSETPLPESPTATVVPIPCNQAILVSDIGLPPGTQVLADSVISKVWRVMNTGSCEWTNQYSLQYSGGNLPSPPPLFFLPAAIQPGETSDLVVSLQAPIYPGDFQALFMVRDPSGTVFGVGQDRQTPLETRFTTILPAYNSSSTYDLVANSCTASWTSASGLLNCPGSALDVKGSVQMVQSAVVESLQFTGYGLRTRPDNSSNGFINGQYPAYFVQSGDIFFSEIGCYQNNPGCNLLFRLEYQASDGQSGTFGIWQETNDRNTTPIEIDLSSLAGRNVWLNLQVVNRGSWQSADGYWHQPRIQRGPSANTPALSWSRSGGIRSNDCRALRIRMSGVSVGIAQAYSCRDEMRDLGARSLTYEEAQRIQEWIQRLGDFEVELYIAAQGDPVTVSVSLNGLGSANAREADIRAIDTYCNEIYTSIVR